MNRRQLLTAAGSVPLAATAGCLTVIPGVSTAEYRATPAHVPADVLQRTGYDQQGIEAVEPVEDEEEYQISRRLRDVEVRNYRSEYDKRLDLGFLGEISTAEFNVVTTPQVRVLGREYNHVPDRSTPELVELVQRSGFAVHDVDHVTDDEIVINGTRTTQSRFTASRTIAGFGVDIFLHVSEAVELGDDWAFAVAGYPQLTPDEREHVFTLMEAIEPRP